jgi:hypothetical protein
MPCLERNEYSTRTLPRMSAGGHQFVNVSGTRCARQAGFGGEQAHRGDDDLSIDLLVIMTKVRQSGWVYLLRVSCHRQQRRIPSAAEGTNQLHGGGELVGL